MNEENAIFTLDILCSLPECQRDCPWDGLKRHAEAIQRLSDQTQRKTFRAESAHSQWFGQKSALRIFAAFKLVYVIIATTATADVRSQHR
jgi:hypothetical protein